MVVVGRRAADIRVLAARQVEPFDDAQLGEDLERAEDRRPSDPEATAPSLAHEIGRREMADLVGDELGDGAPRRRQAVPGAIEGHEERFWISHRADHSTNLDRVSIRRLRQVLLTAPQRRTYVVPTGPSARVDPAVPAAHFGR